MGSWFSNLHIRKNGAATEGAIADFIAKWAAAKQYIPTTTKLDADGAVAIIANSDCQWISLYSDLLYMEDPQKHSEIATVLSSQLHTDILGISCFDSDYLYLNLINTDDKTDAWVGIGSAAGLGIKRRSGLKPWKTKVSDFTAFSESAKKKYVFAEEFLEEIEQHIALPTLQSSASYEDLDEFDLDKKATYFYFKLPESAKSKEPVKLVPGLYSLTPCFIGESAIVNSHNIGGESRGLSVYFLGPYVEHDEITFSEVSFVKSKNGVPKRIPFDLTKVQLSDGQWAYHYHDPTFRIPPKADESLPILKRHRIESERSITVRFVPQGNPRKILDITVVLVPDKNPEGQTGWNVWHEYGSKKAFIDDFNRRHEFFRKNRHKNGAYTSSIDMPPLYLNEEDYD